MFLLNGINLTNFVLESKMEPTEIGFLKGHRKAAIEEAIKIVKSNGRPAELIICRDIPGEHTAGEHCFCSPKILFINPEDL